MICVRNNVLINAVMLYGMIAAKMLLPLVLLPYLTRVLTKDAYGVVAFVKSLMMYAQILVDFGFMLSATKDIALSTGDKCNVNRILGDVLVARILLAVVAFVGTVLAVCLIPLLRPYALFALLSFIPVFLTIFLFDYFFRGIEKMGYITSRFVLMRTIAVALTFFFVHGDNDIVLIPVLDSIGSLVAVVFVWRSIVREGYGLSFSGLVAAYRKIKESFLYFISNMATTAFGALNTLIIGIAMDAPSVAEWSLCFQCVTAVQQLYSPITDSLFPYMVKRREAGFAAKIFIGFMLVVLVGCVITYFGADKIMQILGGDKYVSAGMLLRAFIPVLFMSFPAMFFGWPILGAIGAAKETTLSTITTGVLQLVGLGALLSSGVFTLINLAVLRGLTETYLFGSRLYYCIKYKERLGLK